MTRIIVDEKIRHGKPCVEGTRLTVEDIMEMLENGMTYQDIEKEYGLQREHILAVIKYTASFMRGEEIHTIVS